jgi:hypothetical protein
MINVIWKVLGRVFPGWGVNVYVPFVLALLVGLLIYFQSAPAGSSNKDRLLGVIFALLNSMTLAATALGISEATKTT